MSLAVLSRQFFVDQPPHSDLFQKWQASYSWNENILPIYEWDSILYIGVTEHHELSFDFPCVQILCKAEDLQNVWLSYQSSEVAPASGFAVSSADSSVVPSGDEFTALSQVSDETPAAPQKDADPFASLEGELAPAQLNNSGSPADILQADSAEAPVNTHDEEHSQMSVEANQDDAPGGLVMDVPAPKLSFDIPAGPVLKAAEPAHEEKTQAIEVPKQEEEVAEPLQPIPAMPAKAEKPATPPVTASAVAAKPAATPGSLSARKPLTQPPGMPSFTPPMPTPGAKPAAMKTPVAPAGAAPAAQAPVLKAGGTPPAAGVKDITVSSIARETDTFAQMHNYFQKAMILQVDGKVVRPWKWDDRFKPAAQTSDFDLETPSPFRIVNRTGKPYHGYIVSSELNEKFFQEWNNNEMPDHLTLAPVIIDDQVVAMLLCIGDKASDNKLSLQHAEKVAAKLSVEMKQAVAKAA